MQYDTVRFKKLYFIGSARKDLKEFPVDVQSEIGNALHSVQWGGVPIDSKPLKGFGGASVAEIAVRHDTNAYRAVYTVKFARAIYVLHCFQKKSKSGIATTKQDLELIKSRLRDAREDYEAKFGQE